MVSLMREAQQRLRHQGFLYERACYAALLLPHDSTTAFALVCGDCCVGYRPEGGQTEWLTRSHTLANVCSDLGIEVTSARRQIVTRTLNVRRFEPPQVTQCDRLDAGAWILATDGFIAEQTLSDNLHQDDRSCLQVGLGIQEYRESDSDNIFVRTVDGPSSTTLAKSLGSYR